MATTHTTYYNLTKPSIGGDSNAWGQMLNDDLDTIDSTMKVHANAVDSLSNSLKPVATSGKYSDLTGTPTLGTAAAKNAGDFATAAQGVKADNAMPKSGGTFTGRVDAPRLYMGTDGVGNAGNSVVHYSNSYGDIYSGISSGGNIGFYDMVAKAWLFRIVSGTTNAVVNGTITATDHINSSDRRLKQNIQPAENILKGAPNLWEHWPEAKAYRWKKTGEADYGVIAQEVQELLPELVHEGDDGMLGVAYGKLAIVLLHTMRKEVLKLQARVAELEAKIDRT